MNCSQDHAFGNLIMFMVKIYRASRYPVRYLDYKDVVGIRNLGFIQGEKNSLRYMICFIYWQGFK